MYRTFTDEQQEIIYSDFSDIYVDAKAGTGKTTTLSEFAKIRRYESFLYLVYNKNMRISAKSKFSPNVTIHTIHSYAFQEFGYQFEGRLVHNLKVEHVFETLDFFKDKSMSDGYYYNIAYEVIQKLNEFCSSEDRKISHFNEDIDRLVKEYWGLLNSSNSNVKISHDVYLKMFFLTNPILNFDYIIVDEAQDLNAVAKGIIENQKNVKKVYVGDNDQKIYGFRGAINIFEHRKGKSIKYSLTKSFRFGEDIANVANKILKEFKKDSLYVVGNNEIDSKILYKNNFDEQYTIITRTNAELIEEAVRLSNEGKKIHIVGGFEEIKIQALNIYYLYKNRKEKITSDFLRKLKNFQHLVALAEQTNNSEYKLMISLIERYGDFLEKEINLVSIHNTSEKLSDVVLVTAHKSKGLEFYNVVLSNDFAELFKGDNKQNVEEEEINLIYVAVTRAIESLVLNHDLKKLMEL